MNKKMISFDRNFDTLLFDSIEFLFKAKEIEELNSLDDFNQSLSRSSILFSILLLESAANICIQELQLESSILKEIDRLPILGKFDFYLRCRFRNKKLLRGNKYIEGIRELKRIRDNFVHMKKHKVEWEKKSKSEMWAESERTKVIKISKNPKFWDSKDAIIAMKTTHGFLNFYFSELCKFNKTKVSSMLFSRNKFPLGEENLLFPAFSREENFILSTLNINLSYMKIALV